MKLELTMRKNLSRAARGFTIAEIIVVVIIIGVLATIVATRVLPRIGQSKQSVATANAAAIASAVESYMADCGPPEAGASLEMILMQKPAGAAADKWMGPYLKNSEQLMDPWGKQFVLVIPGTKNVDFDIISYGRDGVAGGEGEDKDVIKP